MLDSELLISAEKIKNHCIHMDSCENCIFFKINQHSFIEMCPLMDSGSSPMDWILDSPIENVGDTNEHFISRFRHK